LEERGAQSTLDVRTLVRLHLEQACPRIAEVPASEVTPEHIMTVLRRLVEAGKGRTANKLRAYIRAAFQTALAAKYKASLPSALSKFGVTNNPAAVTFREERYDKADKNPLSSDEMRSY